MRNFTFVALSLIVMSSSAAFAQSVQTHFSEKVPGLLKKVKLNPTQATQAFAKAFPQATVKEFDLDVEHGRKVYSFEYVEKGDSKTHERSMDANSGELLSEDEEDND